MITNSEGNPTRSDEGACAARGRWFRLNALASAALVVGALVTAACSSDAGAGAAPTGGIAQGCVSVCASPAGPCETEDRTGCVTSCEARMRQVDAGCAQCLLRYSGWAGNLCTCDGTTCETRTFGPIPSVGDTGPGVCDPVKSSVCYGYRVAEPTDSPCADACSGLTL